MSRKVVIIAAKRFRTRPPLNRSTARDDVLLRIDRRRGNVVRSLQNELRRAIRTGRLRCGQRVPATRTLAVDLGVSRSVVVEAYAQLLAEGYLVSRTGSGTRVSDAVETGTRTRPLRRRTEPPIEYNFIPGTADPALFPRHEWQTSVARVLRSVAGDVLLYPDPSGQPRLRETLASYLGRARGAVAEPEGVVIAQGFAQVCSLFGRILIRRGICRIGVEEPGTTPGNRHVIGQTGLEAVPVPVDDEGLRVDRLAALGLRAVVVTPSHQYPTGVVLSGARRTELIRWARETGGYVLEDDYDAEYRFDRQPVGALQGLAPDSVILGSSASKTLVPGLRLGWVVPPRALLAEFQAEKRAADHGSPVIDQLALADFFESGAFARHLRRARPVYRARRDALVAALDRHLPGHRVRGIAAGLQLMIDLPPTADEPRIVREALRQGVLVRGLDYFRVRPAESDSRGLVLGFELIAESRIEPGVERLARIVATYS